MASTGTIFFVWGAAVFFAQLSPAADTAGQIRLSVTALDSGGQPVDGLKSDDFQIADQGKPQKIIFFRAKQSATAAIPNDHSNRASMPHIKVIVFDLLNEPLSDRLNVWHSLGKSLQQLHSGDSLYFYLLTLEGTLSPIHEIGGTAGDDKTWTQTIEKTLDKAMKAANHNRPAVMDDQEMVVKKTYVALETLANKLAPFPGRRDIVWITNGMPNVWNPKTPCNGDWVDCALYVPHLSFTLERDNVAVDPVSYSSNPTPDMTRDLEQLSGLTGGWTYVGEEMGAVLKEVDRDAASSYTLAYDMPLDSWDSKFHKIRVTSENKAIKLRTQQRYYAYPDKRTEDVRRHTALAAAYQSPFDYPEIGLRAAAVADGNTLHLQIRVNPADLSMHEDGANVVDDLTVLLEDIGASGPMGEPAMSGASVNLTHEQKDAAMKDGIAIAQDHPVTAAVQKVRVIVLDQGSDVTGSLTIPVKR
ncbi:MAG: VWA domain-containing protein [Bryobacteraceae bacterium]